MKKLISLILAFAILLTFAACSGSPDVTESSENEPTDETIVAGGWTVNTEFGEVLLPEAAKAAFEKATTEIAGKTYTPVAYLGSQVVAGTKYAFLCTGTAAVAKPVTELYLVSVYRDLDGNCTLNDPKQINISDYTKDGSIDFNSAEMAGGWNVSDSVGAPLSAKTQSVFDSAFAELDGISYSPLACLGTQVVAGTNYAILCSTTSSTAEPAIALAVATVYVDLDGNASVLYINGFSFQQ